MNVGLEEEEESEAGGSHGNDFAMLLGRPFDTIKSGDGILVHATVPRLDFDPAFGPP